jgi:ABC-type multidrug transport system ATPase subunit
LTSKADNIQRSRAGRFRLQNTIRSTPLTATPITPLIIHAQQLGKRFNREWIFRGLSLPFESDKTYAIVGPNGSGKSTLLQILWGQMPPSSGTVTYKKNGKDIESDAVYQYVSIATPYMDLVDEFRLSEQFRFHFTLRKSRNGLSVEQLLKEISMADIGHKYIGNLSSGMKQRVKLALALFTEADAIFLDEPGTNLDEKAFGWYVRQLSKIPSQCLVFIASNQSREYPSDAVIVDITSFK